LPQTAISPDGSILFQVLDGRWINAVLIDVDYTGRQVAGMHQGPAKEKFRRGGVTPGGQEEIDRLSRGIDCPIEESLLSVHLNARFIQPPTLGFASKKDS